jgi:3-hydroxy acid dehydrogenase / malonic semialdehyde reductase
MAKTVLITGATAGFGEACARLFASNSWNCIITGRRNDRLEKLAFILKNAHNIEVLPLCFDVRDRKATLEILGKLPARWQNIDVLINNAGLASGFGPIDEGNPDDWDVMIDTNVKGLLYVSHAIIPFMKKRNEGHIINIGSIAGKETYKNGNVYCATKHAVDALTKAMRIDLLPYHIKVTGVCPGAAETEFSIVRYKGDTERAAGVYKGFKPLTAQDIADVVYYAATRPAHVNLNDIVITPTVQANTSHLLKDEE